MVNLVPAASVVGGSFHKFALCVFEASAENDGAVSQRESYQAVAVSAPRTQSKLAQDVPLCHALRSSSLQNSEEILSIAS